MHSRAAITILTFAATNILLGTAPARGSALRDVPSETLVLKNHYVLRELRRDGDVWRTVRFARADGSDELVVRSDEFHILLLDDTQVTLDDYAAVGEPKVVQDGTCQTITIEYRLRDEGMPAAVARRVTVKYRLSAGPYLRKSIILDMKQDQAVDRLQVERFITDAKTRRGGRGEPVFLNESWFGGLEYPASYIRHGRDFQYPDYQLRNPSKIFLEDRDKELGPTPAGLVTMAHFPGRAGQQEASGRWSIRSKTSVFGIGRRGDTVELSFLDYLQTIRRARPRSFLHHNNWYDRSGKDLSVENYIGRTYRQLRDGLAPYGVTLDGLVPDSGWQDRNSIWRPKDAVDFTALRQALQKESRGHTRLGLWLALNGYSLNVDWGRQHGYLEAERNEWFQRFKRYYALTQPEYNASLRRSLRNLITDGNLSYFKHDFNEMCDLGSRAGHLPTDRHGHEANVDAMIDLLAYERQLQPDIYQNLTNWIWFSPWWLMHADCLWMMGSDSGSNWAWPQLAVRDISTTFRDEHFSRLWTDPLNRPLIPISSLMTHGIIFADGNRRGDPHETLHDWSNYVMMYYGRGVMLKELYITPGMMTPERWKVLGMATRWAVDNASRLVNTVAIGGNPERGELHGYVSWTDAFGLLILRNPDRREQSFRVPFDQTTWFRGALGCPWYGRVVYPFVETMNQRFTSGQPLMMTVPGDSVMVFELRPGKAPAGTEPLKLPARPHISTVRETGGITFTVHVPDEEMLRCDLVIQTFQGPAPAFTLDGKSIPADRETEGTVKPKREIRGKATIATTRKPKAMGASDHWVISSVDLRPYRGRTVSLCVGCRLSGAPPFRQAGNSTVDAWFIADRAVDAAPAPAGEPLPFAISQRHRRQTIRLIEPTKLNAPPAPSRVMRASDWNRVTAAKVRLRVFGVNGGTWGPITVQCNGVDLVDIPANQGGDRWETVELDVPQAKLSAIRSSNSLRLSNPHHDKFKFAGPALAVQVSGKEWAVSSATDGVFCSSDDWKYAEGRVFPTLEQSPSVTLAFQAKPD